MNRVFLCVWMAVGVLLMGGCGDSRVRAVKPEEFEPLPDKEINVGGGPDQGQDVKIPAKKK